MARHLASSSFVRCPASILIDQMPAPTSPEQDNNHADNSADLGEFPGEDGNGAISIRALISTKEAGIIIGQAGKTVAGIRNENDVKAGVSKVVQGVQDRVLSITGQVENVSKVRRSWAV
jgi:heterogeneous nuclear rnp K-like protein 2